MRAVEINLSSLLSSVWIRHAIACRAAVSAAAVATLVSACGGHGYAPRPSIAKLTQTPATVTGPSSTRPTTTDRDGRKARATNLAIRSVSGTAAGPLAGKTVGVDPGHNGDNHLDPAYIDRQIWNGREYEDCNTTGTETDAGYTEAEFNWNVGEYLVADLKSEGAKVVLTRHSNDGVGPCVTRRAQIMDEAHVNVAIAIHADGGPADGRGFAILEPVADHINHGAIAGSYRFARVLRSSFLSGTGMPESTYDGVDGLQPRDNLAGENLTRVPYALIECGNMRNATDAGLLITSAFQKRAAAAMASAITVFLTGQAS